MRKRILQFAMFGVLLGVALAAFSQGGPPPPPPPLPPPGSGVPIDGGIFLLLAAGLIYGSKKLYKGE